MAQPAQGFEIVLTTVARITGDMGKDPLLPLRTDKAVSIY
jgi:hypothetical protein